MGVEHVAIPAIAAISRRPALANALFRFTKWGNPFVEERFSYPYPMYERMRSDGPVVYQRAYQQWFVFGHDEVLEVLRSPHACTSGIRDRLLSVRPYSKLSPEARTNFSRWLLVNDPPDHTRLRRAVGRAFAPNRIASVEPLVRSIVDDLIAGMSDVDELDVVERFTARLPIFVIAELLGLPRDRWEWLLDASRRISDILDPFGRFDPAAVDRSFRELGAHFGDVVEQRRREPRSDLISALAAAQDNEVLDTDEVIAMIVLLLFAGHETVAGLLGNSIVALARFPEQRSLLRARPEIIDNAVEELLRYDTPAQATGRLATDELTVGGVTIPRGAAIALMLGAANRDTRRWPDGDELRLNRPEPAPISFGSGIHVCVGAALARLEARVALPRLLDAFGDYTVDDARVRWKRSLTLRGPTELPIRKGPSASIGGVP